MTMANLLFTRDFDAEIEEERRSAEAVVPVYNSDDLAAAVEEARQEGFSQGLAQGMEDGRAELRAELEARRVEALEHLMPEIAALIADRETYRACLETDMAAYVRDMSEMILPELLQSLGWQRLDTEIARIIKRAVGSPTLEIRVSPVFADSFAAELSSPSDHDEPAIRVVPDAALEPAEVCATWRNGRSRYSFAAQCRSILALISDVASSPKHKAEEGPQDV